MVEKGRTGGGEGCSRERGRIGGRMGFLAEEVYRGDVRVHERRETRR
jgi:hypothetical protein